MRNANAVEKTAKSLVNKEYSWCNAVMGRPQCNRGIPGIPGKCQKNRKIQILEGPRKVSNTIEKNVKWGPGDVDFGPPAKCQKHVEWTFWGGVRCPPGK